MLNEIKEKATDLKKRWDAVPDYEKKALLITGGIGIGALYFYNVGYDWGWKCAKEYYRHEDNEKLRHILDQVCNGLADGLNSDKDDIRIPFEDILGTKRSVRFWFTKEE